jgi:hypothetical protein
MRPAIRACPRRLSGACIPLEVASLRPRRDLRSRLFRLSQQGSHAKARSRAQRGGGVGGVVGNSQQRHDPANKAPPPPDLVSLRQGSAVRPRSDFREIARRTAGPAAHATGVGAVLHFVPHLFPLLPPDERAPADHAVLRRQVGLFLHLGHGRDQTKRGLPASLPCHRALRIPGIWRRPNCAPRGGR